MKIGIAVLIGILLTTTELYALTAEWNRNTEADVSHYEMFACSTSATCIPGTDAASQLGADIPQPAIGVKPTMPIPADREGRIGVIAIDLVGNKSPLSNIVPFDAKAPGVPTGLLTKP